MRSKYYANARRRLIKIYIGSFIIWVKLFELTRNRVLFTMCPNLSSVFLMKSSNSVFVWPGNIEAYRAAHFVTNFELKVYAVLKA